MQEELVRLGGGDAFADVLRRSEAHREEHGCGLYPAGAAVMQVAASYVRAARPATVLDLGCGIGYSTLWLAAAAGPGARVTGIDSDASHIDLARSLADRPGMADVGYVVGDVEDVLAEWPGPVDAIHDDAWFGGRPPHLERMLALLRPGGVLTMPNWFLLIDALTGSPRNDWARWAGPAWAHDTRAYAEHLASRTDIDVCWIAVPPLAVAVKQPDGSLSAAAR